MADISQITPTEFIAIEIAASVHAASPPTVALAPVVGASDRLVDLLPAAVYVCDASGIVVRCNQRAVELWGRSPKLGDPAERFCGSYRLYRLDGAPLPHAECPVVDVLRTGVAVRDQEVVIERPDGSHVIVVANIEALKDDTGNIVGAVNCLYEITERKRIEQELRASQAALRASEERLAADLAATRQMQEISTSLIREGSIDAIYERMLDAAVGVMKSDAASMQVLDRDRGELRLLTSKGFHPASAAFWQWVRLDSESTCGTALRDGRRIVVPDVEACDLMAGTADLDAYRQSGIRAVQSTPLVSRSGRLLGMISTHWREPHQPSAHDLRLLDVLARQAADLVERAQAEANVRENEERLRRRTETLLNEAPLGVYLVDADLRIREVNSTALPLFGDIPGLIGRDFDEVIHLVLPKAHADETVARFRHALETGAPYRVPERVRERPDRGATEYYEWQINRIPLPEGRHGVVCYFRDVSAQVVARRRLSESRERLATELAATHRLQEQQGLLLREMNHRVKNLFAVANGLLALSARSVRTPQELASAVRERLDALARAHELVLPEWTGDGAGGGSETTLHALLRAIFLPYARPDRTGERDCLAVDGPGVAIGAGAVTSMALLLHEFAVNSAKYGALSSPDGSVAIDWSAENGDLVLRWRERGGPAVAGPPAVEGFGSLLARRTVTGHFGGRLSRDWRPEGLTIDLVVPMKRLG